jgi:hypothetical protein
MDVMIVYDLLEIARGGATRLMTFRTPDDISPAVVMGTADAFLSACEYARGVMPILRTGVPFYEAQDEALIQMINAALAARHAGLMVRIAISEGAFDVIAKTLALGSVG